MTPVLVTYASQFGSTQGIAERIADVLRRHGLDVTAAPAGSVAAADYDAFVVGSAVHAGHWLPAATAFVRDHRSMLATRPVWLFSSGPLGDRAAGAPQPDPGEVEELRASLAPIEHRVFGGSYDRGTADWSGLGLIERTVVKRFLPDGDWRDWGAIDRWAAGIARRIATRKADAVA